MGSIIKKIDRSSPLFHKAHVGDRLIAINGNEILDVLDYKFFCYETKLSVELESVHGHRRTVSVKKPEGGELGLEFESYLMDKARACSNHCLFCFVDQLPAGMRETMYFKDDDARLSFLTGNYITLTNLSEREIERIIALHISPINVSVHATNPELRAKLIGNKNAAGGYELMKRLARGGIVMNCQIVCCPGFNDGEELSRSMEELEALWPQVYSVSIVPVGLTKHRDKLPKLRMFDAAGAAEAIDRVHAFSEICRERHGSRIFFCSDEMYIKAGRDIPPDEYYEDYTQYENGVGILRLQQVEFAAAMDNFDGQCLGTPFTIATGVSARAFLEKLLVTAKKKYDNIDGKVLSVQNDFFGHTIDVAGLVTGGDLINQLRGQVHGSRLIIPEVMVRDGVDIFLDDVTIADVERELGVKTEILRVDGGELFDAMMK